MVTIQAIKDKIALMAKKTGQFAISKPEFFGTMTDIVDKVDEVSNHMNSNAKQLIWQEPVATIAELTTKYPTPELGWAAMVTGVGFVYSYNGTAWKSTGLTAFPQDVATQGKSGVYVLSDSSQILNDYVTKADARNAVPSSVRKPFLTLIYSLNGVIQREIYTQKSVGSWALDTYWLDEIKQSNERYVANGCYLIKDGNDNLKNFNSRGEAREAVPTSNRWIGLTIVYKLKGVTVFESFTHSNNQNWLSDAYWKDLKNENRLYIGTISSTLSVNPGNYIKEVSCTKSTNLSLVIAFLNKTVDDVVQKKITFYVAEFDNAGVFVKYIAKKQNLDLFSITKSPNTIIQLDKYTPSDPVVSLIIDVERLLDEKVVSFEVSSAPATPTPEALIKYSYFNDINFAGLNDSTINFDKVYPFTNLPLNWQTHFDIINASKYFKAILAVEVEMANENTDFVYNIALLSKNRVANDWGNGIRINKLLKTDTTTIVATVDYKYSISPDEVKKELDKISQSQPTWMYVKAHGVLFKILVDGTYITDGGSGDLATAVTSAFWGYYLDETTYRRKTSETSIATYETVTRAAQDGAHGVLNVGENLFIGNSINVENFNAFLAKPIEENYKPLSETKKFPPILKSELKRFSLDDVNMYVCSFSNKHIYYSTCRTESGIFVSQADMMYPFMAYANKNTPDSVIKINIPSLLPGNSYAECGRRHLLYEMADGTHLLEVENGVAISANVRKRNLYKISGLFDLLPEANEVTIPLENIELLFSLPGGESRILSSWTIREYGKTIILAPYGAGVTALVYISHDCFDTWKCIFNGGVEDVFVHPKNSVGNWPTPESVVPANSIDWSLTGNGNVHVHGVAFDKWYNRIWVVTGDGGSTLKSVTGIWYTDDEGLIWHKVELGGVKAPFYQYGTQMIGIIPLEKCVLFPTDGAGDGYFRYNRNGKDKPVEIELAFQYTGSNTILGVIGGGEAHTKDGFCLSLFNPDNEDQGDYSYKGGVVATSSGYSFEKIWVDEFSQGTKATAEIGWQPLITCDSNKLLLKAANGGYIELSY